MNQYALVTGGGHGIGKEIALELARMGYDVGLSYCGSKEQALDTVSQIKKLGQRAVAIQADLSQLDQVDRLFDGFFAEFDALHVLVNNAGLTKYAPFLEVTPELFEQLIGLDFRGAFFVSQRGAKEMVARQIHGSIVNISSVHRLTNYPHASVYGPAKAAVYKMTQHMALELAPHGIRVNSISPGYIKVTDPNVVSEREAMMVSRIPAGCIGHTSHIAKAVGYLISPQADYMTGSDLIIDGGALLPAVLDNHYT